MTPEQREELKRLVRPYVITALRYPSSHAPDNHFDFPLSEEFEGVFPYTLITPHGYYPLYRDPEMLEEKFEHFGCELRIQAPLITQAAKLLYFACLETVSIPPPPGIPATRAHAVALNLPDGIPTTEDYEEMNAHKSAQLVDVGSWDWRAELNEEQGRLEDDGVPADDGDRERADGECGGDVPGRDRVAVVGRRGVSACVKSGSGLRAHMTPMARRCVVTWPPGSIDT